MPEPVNNRYVLSFAQSIAIQRLRMEDDCPTGACQKPLFATCTKPAPRLRGRRAYE